MGSFVIKSSFVLCLGFAATACTSEVPESAVRVQADTVVVDNVVRIMGKCLDITGGALAAGTPFQLWDCNHSMAQHFRLLPDGQLRTVDDIWCVTVSNGSSVNGTPIVLQRCSDSSAQRFRFNTQFPNSIEPQFVNRCFDARAGSSANGTRIQIFDCNGDANQQFVVSFELPAGSLLRTPPPLEQSNPVLEQIP